MENVIVTGADGFVGSNVVKYLLEKKIKVVAVGRKDVPARLLPQEGLQYVQADAFNEEQLIERIPKAVYDTMIHFAWNGSAGDARKDYSLQMRNAIMNVACLRVAKRLGCRRFVCAGSIMEKETMAVILAQGSTPGAAYHYGMGKLAAHGLCKIAAVEYGIDLIWGLITNAYGEGEYSPRFINTTIRKMFHQEPLQFTAATQNYDFIHIDDVARAIYLIASRGKPFYEYVIGSGTARPLKEFIMEIRETISPKADLLFGDVPFSGINLPLADFDIAGLTEDTEFVPKVTFSEGIKRTAEWLKTIENTRGI